MSWSTFSLIWSKTLLGTVDGILPALPRPFKTMPSLETWLTGRLEATPWIFFTGVLLLRPFNLIWLETWLSAPNNNSC